MDTKDSLHNRSRKQTQQKLKVIAALVGGRMLATLDRLVLAEYDRLHKGRQKDAGQPQDQA
jgi:hypothetical protein